MTTTMHEDERRCLALADVLILVAEMLGSPDEWTRESSHLDPALISELEDASALSGAHGHDGPLVEACAAWRRVSREDARVSHDNLFDGRLTCPPNETTYVRRDKGAILADIAGFYRAFGFRLAGDFGEKHDHLRVELQFAAMLLVMAGRSDERSAPEGPRIAESALRSFLADHLGCWLGAFATRLEATAQLEYYRLVARVLLAIDEALASLAGLPPERCDQGAYPLPERGTPYECGLAGGACPKADERGPFA